MYIAINRLGRKRFSTAMAARKYARQMNKLGMTTRVIAEELV